MAFDGTFTSRFLFLCALFYVFVCVVCDSQMFYPTVTKKNMEMLNRNQWCGAQDTMHKSVLQCYNNERQGLYLLSNVCGALLYAPPLVSSFYFVEDGYWMYISF